MTGAAQTRRFQVVDLGQQMIDLGQPIPDLEAVLLEAFPFTVTRQQFYRQSPLTTLDHPFDQTLAQTVAELYALKEFGYATFLEFDVLVFEEGSSLMFRLQVEVERQPVASCSSSVQVTP